VSSPASARVEFVAWNMHVGNGDLAGLIGAIRTGELTGEPAERFVLLLQEVVRRGSEVPASPSLEARIASHIGLHRDPVDDIGSIAARERLNLAYVPSMRNGPEREDRGNAILTTESIAGVDAIELPFGHQRRVVVAARLANGSRVVSVHFDTAFRAWGGPAAWRREQADALLEQLGRDGGPIVVGGDLNTWWGQPEPAVAAFSARWSDAIDRVDGDTWRGPIGLSSRTDHLFAGGLGRKIVVRRARQRYESDHFPLYMTLDAAALERAH
jgi:endonuclease/exonuclease/phosphatase family metal-dependent hydrolase